MCFSGLDLFGKEEKKPLTFLVLGEPLETSHPLACEVADGPALAGTGSEKAQAGSNGEGQL